MKRCGLTSLLRSLCRLNGRFLLVLDSVPYLPLVSIRMMTLLVSVRLPRSRQTSSLIVLKPMSDLPKRNNGYIPKFFSRTEFQLCTPSCELEDMDEDFLKKLDHLREVCDFPLTITCAYRSVEYDKAKGRSGTSWHTRGRAVDIYCTNLYRRFAIVHNAPFCGLNGIGVGSTFVHVDDRIVQTMWTY